MLIACPGQFTEVEQPKESERLWNAYEKEMECQGYDKERIARQSMLDKYLADAIIARVKEELLK
jgi:hypothetical protein